MPEDIFQCLICFIIAVTFCICCYVATVQCTPPLDEGAVMRPSIGPFILVHLVFVWDAGCNVCAHACVFASLLSLFRFNKNTPATKKKQTERKKKAIYFWSSATAFSEKISKAERNIVSADCNANKTEIQWIKPKPFDSQKSGFDQPGCFGLRMLS